MAPMLKRSKIIDGPNSRISKSKSISSFAKISKASALLNLYKKDKTVGPDEDSTHKPVVQASKSNKRQREEDSEPESRERRGNVVPVVHDQDGKNTQRKRARVAISQDHTQSPTRGSRVLLENLNISRPSQVAEIFDEEIQDMIDLHSAFLNALAIHYAHHGTASPVDLKILASRIELKWGKRRIDVEDIQKILGIQHLESRSAISLVQRTRTRVCIEYDSDVTAILPVETLKKTFIVACRRLHGAEVPLESIKTETSVESSSLSKGAQRLEEIKAIAIQAQPSPVSSIAISQQSPRTETPTNRAASLLDRIRSKQTFLSSLPAGPTPEVLAKRALLHRLEEIIPILSVLSGSSSAPVSSRNLYTSTTSLASLSSLGSSLGLGPIPPAKVVSFTMGNVVQHLQNSMRHPMAREDVEKAVRLLAAEVAPRWIQVTDVGSVVGVTFRGKIGRAEWSARLGALLA